tara:strand:+ start:5704 stop:6834 length:1131 start_codon:yes stop_codon:yes gene_type:complete
MKFIDLEAQQNVLISEKLTLRDEINKRIQKVLNEGNFIQGPEVIELESSLKNFTGSKFCITTSSGTDALLIALMAIGTKPGDEIITTPFSFISTTETIVLLGATPKYVDIDPNTYNINPQKMEERITKKTKAIIPVSLYGQTADFTSINKVAKKFNLPVIEDGAQSFGAEHKKKKSCNLSTIGTTSFFPSKPLGCYGDGGACFTNDKELADKMRIISLHGQTKRYFHQEIGINGRLDTLQAAVLLAKLKIFNQEINLRNKVANRYTNALNQLGFDATPRISEDNLSVFAQYTIQVENRESFQLKLKERNIPTSVHYPTLLYRQPAFNKSSKNELINCENIFKTAERICKKVVSLPMYPYLTIEDQDKIIETIKDIL